MQSSDFEPDQRKTWLRRPTIFVALGWMLLCAAGQILLSKMALPLTRLFGALGWPVSRYRLALVLGTVYHVGLMLCPALCYALRHEGVNQAMRLKKPAAVTLLYAPIIGAALVPLSRTATIMWSLLLQTAGGTPTYSVRGPTSPGQLVLCLVLDALVAASCHEFMMRGAIMGAWERRGTERALVVVTILSATLSGSITELPANALVYLMLGLIVLMSGSLVPGIIAHAVYAGLMIWIDYAAGPYEITDLWQTIVAAGRLWPYLMTLLWSAALYVGLIAMFRALCVQRGLWKGFKEAHKPEEMDYTEVLILCIVFITVGLMLLESFISICPLK